MSSNFLAEIAVFVPAILTALTVHEFAHAWVANKCGDPTAKNQGRVTLNPLAHLDLMGTIAFVVLHFGWGKPVPVEPRNYGNLRRDTIFVSGAGPLSNLIMAILFGIALKFSIPYLTMDGYFIQFFYQAIFINLILLFFNLIPLFPLDGSHILENLLPPKLARKYSGHKPYGMGILLGALLLSHYLHIPLFSVILYPAKFLHSLIFNLAISY